MRKGQTTICKTLHIKLRIKQHTKTTKTRGEVKCSVRVGSSCSTGGARRVTPVQLGYSTKYDDLGLDYLCIDDIIIKNIEQVSHEQFTQDWCH